MVNENQAVQAGVPLLAQHRRYAACTLARMTRSGLVARARRGLYRINRHHPELMAIRKVGRPDQPGAP